MKCTVVKHFKLVHNTTTTLTLASRAERQRRVLMNVVKTIHNSVFPVFSNDAEYKNNKNKNINNKNKNINK